MAATPNITKAAGNNLATTLATTISPTDTAITLSTGSGFNTNGGFIVIDEGTADKEIIYYESRSGNTLTVATDGRGQAGTSAVAHSAGAVITDVGTAENINGIAEQFLVEHGDDGTHLQINSSLAKSGTLINSSNKIIDEAYDRDWRDIGSTASRVSDLDPVFVIRFSGQDLTGTLSKGMRIRWKEGGSFKYGIIHDVTLNSGDTDVAVFGGTDYDVGTGTLTDIYFSSAKVPYGFPVGVTKWQIDTGPGGTAQASPTGGTWYNLGGSITLPQGEWIVNIASGTFMKYSGQNTRAGFLTLSTGNNTESNTDNTIANGFGFRDADNADELRLYGHAAYTLFIAVSTETTYYLNSKVNSGVTEIALNNARIYASNAYL